MLIESSKSIQRVINRKLKKLGFVGTIHTSEPDACWVTDIQGKSTLLIEGFGGTLKKEPYHLTVVRGGVGHYASFLTYKRSRFLSIEENLKVYNAAEEIARMADEQGKETLDEMAKELEFASKLKFSYAEPKLIVPKNNLVLPKGMK